MLVSLKPSLQFSRWPPGCDLISCLCYFNSYMVTSGMDKKLKVFDIRAFKPLQSYFLPAGASSLSLSHRGLLSAATGDIVQVTITLQEIFPLTIVFSFVFLIGRN